MNEEMLPNAIYNFFSRAASRALRSSQSNLSGGRRNNNSTSNSSNTTTTTTDGNSRSNTPGPTVNVSTSTTVNPSASLNLPSNPDLSASTASTTPNLAEQLREGLRGSRDPNSFQLQVTLHVADHTAFSGQLSFSRAPLTADQVREHEEAAAGESNDQTGSNQSNDTAEQDCEPSTNDATPMEGVTETTPTENSNATTSAASSTSRPTSAPLFQFLLPGRRGATSNGEGDSGTTNTGTPAITVTPPTTSASENPSVATRYEISFNGFFFDLATGRPIQFAPDFNQQNIEGLLMRALEEFLGQLAGVPVNGGLQGQPPASKVAKEGLARIIPPGRDCSICMEGMIRSDEDDVVRRLPCGHAYHEKCLFPWLDRSNTCPSCRYEIMTDNEEYNKGVTRRMASRSTIRFCELAPLGLCEYSGEEGPLTKWVKSQPCGCWLHEECGKGWIVADGRGRCPKHRSGWIDTENVEMGIVDTPQV